MAFTFDNELTKISLEYLQTVIEERGFLADKYCPIIKNEEEKNEKQTA